MASKTTSKTQKAKPRSGVKASAVTLQPTNAELRQQLAESLEREKAALEREKAALKDLQNRDQQLAEALEHQTATSEVLGIISRSPTDVQPLLDAIVESAARVCGIDDVALRLVEGDMGVARAHFGSVPIAPGRESISINELQFRWVREHGTLHIPDVHTQRDIFPTLAASAGARSRTFLIVPLCQHGEFIGTLNARRTEVRPFTPAQIKLLETFADQAVIAIENVRLFNELQERNADLREALEHQTATSEVLSIISRSPTDVQPVLDAIVESAAKVCGVDDVVLRLNENDSMVPCAHFGSIPIGRLKISVDESWIRRTREQGTLHVPDIRAQNEFPTLGSSGYFRTILVAPLRQKQELVGLLAARRVDIRPFTPTQIKLLETFADQAVIAIENVRLFNELKESLEQQTATAEILGVIASSPTDIQPVLNVVAENAARLCEATDAQIRLVEGDGTRLVASFGTLLRAPAFRPTSLRVPSGRALHNRETVHVHDLLEAAKTEFPDSEFQQSQSGTRTFLSTPMLREGIPIGLINIRRTEVRPFSDKQIKLLETFAAQAVIAIENVRLFKEIQERNAELREALEHQTATSEVLGIISRSPTDVQPVLDAIVESAAKVCGIDDVGLRLREGNNLVSRAHFGPIPIPMSRVEISIEEPTVSLDSRAGHTPHSRRRCAEE
jgi:GAF domain-containing protein